jgi:hypothetical protein
MPSKMPNDLLDTPVEAVPSDDDWLLLVIPGVVVLVVGLLKLAEGIFLAVRAWERALIRL